MRKILFSVILAATSIFAMGQNLKKVEPLSWWVGMKHPLQLMLYGTDLKDATVSIKGGEGVSVTKTINADSPNYLFVDVAIAENAKPGEYTIEVKKGKKTLKYPYVLAARKEGSAQRESFSSKDMVYLLMPDRFAQGKIEQPKEQIPGLVERTQPFARHGGNLQGMIDNLDYLADLGVTTIWPTPLTEDKELSGSYHGYAASDFYNIDPRYGNNELYAKFVEEANKKGIKVIMDMVPNHCGIDHPWMKDLPTKTWINHGGKYVQTNYVQASHMDPHASTKEAINCVDGWFVENMPDMNLNDPLVMNYLSQMTIWWIEKMGLQGLRVDTYPYNDKNAAAKWSKSIRDEYPNISIVGECWVNYPALIAYWEGGNTNKDGYDSQLTHVMDFALQDAMSKAIAQNEVSNWYEGMMSLYFVLAQDFLYQKPEELLIFLDNHDTDRFAHFTKGDAKKQMLGITMLATMRGIPQLYYGTEQLFRGNQKEGHGGQRIDFPGGWQDDQRNLFTGQGRTAKEDSVYQHSKKLFNWRKNSDVIHNGKMTQFFPQTPDNIYVYGRHNDNELALVVLNPNATSRKLDWKKYDELFNGYAVGEDIVSGKKVTIGDDVELAPRQSMVIHFKK